MVGYLPIADEYIHTGVIQLKVNIATRYTVLVCYLAFIFYKYQRLHIGRNRPGCKQRQANCQRVNIMSPHIQKNMPQR